MTYTYKDAETMILTRNTFDLTASDAVTPVGLLKNKITYVNGNYSVVDLATGLVTVYSRYRKQPSYNRRNDDPKSYVYTTMYFKDPDPEVTESLYRQGRVHIINCLLSAYHRYLFELALQRAAIQDQCDFSEVIVEIHHLQTRKDNSICDLLPVTPKEHDKIHYALRRGKSTYESLVYGLGETLVHSIFGVDYFNYGDSSVYTAAINGVPYIQLMLNQISAANLPADTTCLRVRLLNHKYVDIDITDLNIYEILSALYNVRAVEIVSK